MRTFVLAMAMASTVLTPSLASAADRPGDRAERRAERRSDVRADRARQRVDRRTDVARDRAVRRGDVREARRIDRYEDRRERRIDRREDRRDRRIDRRYDRHDDRTAGTWNRNWRQDRRYDYRDYRRVNRSLYRAPRYDSPYRNRGYSRLSIGVGLGSGYYNNRYWINDPYRYRLPPVRGSYRWVRYYNDAVLVDTRHGRVADVIYGFFY